MQNQRLEKHVSNPELFKEVQDLKTGMPLWIKALLTFSIGWFSLPFWAHLIP